MSAGQRRRGDPCVLWPPFSPGTSTLRSRIERSRTIAQTPRQTRPAHIVLPPRRFVSLALRFGASRRLDLFSASHACHTTHPSPSPHRCKTVPCPLFAPARVRHPLPAGGRTGMQPPTLTCQDQSGRTMARGAGSAAFDTPTSGLGRPTPKSHRNLPGPRHNRSAELERPLTSSRRSKRPIGGRGGAVDLEDPYRPPAYERREIADCAELNNHRMKQE